MPSAGDTFQLLSDIASGDRRAMKMFYDKYVRYLAAICTRYLDNDEDMHDALQDSFVKIFSSVGSIEYRGDNAFRGWIAKIAVNECIKLIRCHKPTELTVPLSELPDSIPDEQPDTDMLTNDELIAIIKELPEGYRTVFNLFAIEGKSHRDISRLLGIKESSSASQYWRARAMLAEKIRLYRNVKEHAYGR